MDAEQVCGMLDTFWRDRVMQVGEDPRAPHCPYAVLAEFVHNTGVQQRHAFGAHLKVSVDTHERGKGVGIR